MNLLSLIPGPWRLAAALAAAGALAIALWAWGERREAEGYQRGHAEYLQLQAEMAAKAAAAERQARAEDQRRLADQKESADEVQRLAALDRAARAAAAGRADAAGQRLQHTLATIAAGGGAVPGDPAAARQCTADLGKVARVLDACRRSHQQLGRDADFELDDARARGNECTARYDALTPRPPH